MNEPSFHEKEEVHETTVQRLSESRPKFKPVLVKKLLADESDDDSDDQPSNTEHSDEDSDDFDGLQPLPEEYTSELGSASTLIERNININFAIKDGVQAVANSAEPLAVDNIKVENEIKFLKKSKDMVNKTEDEPKSLLNCYLKDSLKISEYVDKNNEDGKLLDESPPLCGAKRKSTKDLNDRENMTLQSQWQPKSFASVDERKSLPVREKNSVDFKQMSYSPEIKRHSQNLISNQVNEIKDRPVQRFESSTDSKVSQESCKFSLFNPSKPYTVNNEGNDEKVTVPSKVVLDQAGTTKTSTSQTSNAAYTVQETPMKHPQGSSRPNPCLSHRNIFQTPQNKVGSEFMKNSIQTPATIFSHWSQQHFAQTPMQNQVSVTRESMQTPATSITQSQNTKHETPRYHTSENKSVRRPLAETMYSSTTHGPQLPRLQELPNENLSSPPILAKESSSLVKPETIVEMKHTYSTSHTTHESKENWNPKAHEIVKSETQSNSQPKLSVSDQRHSINSQIDNKPKLEYQSSALHSNVQVPRPVESHENFKVREVQSQVHPPVQNPQEQIMNIQCAISSQTNLWNPRQNKIITVLNRQYSVLGTLGQGMSCEVFRVHDLSSSELRAIKCVNLSKMDKETAKGCLQEICLLDKLKAPCIVHMYNFEIKQPMVYVVMEIGDTDLSRFIKSMLAEKKKMSLTMILYWWTEMLIAVKHIHDNGVIHSDLKPANFLLVRGRLKLIDFGIASNINSDMTSVVKNCPIGTLNYISPEALLDVNAGNESPNHNVKYKISYKSDVWSLGCILYGLVYGVTPFNHIRQQWAKISAITDPKHKINFPMQNGSDPVPLILIDVMGKCLQRDPKARPTVADLLAVPYMQSSISPSLPPKIPQNILIKIKHALSDEEWQELSKILDRK